MPLYKFSISRMKCSLLSTPFALQALENLQFSDLCAHLEFTVSMFLTQLDGQAGDSAGPQPNFPLCSGDQSALHLVLHRVHFPSTCFPLGSRSSHLPYIVYMVSQSFLFGGADRKSTFIHRTLNTLGHRSQSILSTILGC